MSKRYERMTMEDVISAYNSAYDSVYECDKCLARNWCNNITKKSTCVETITAWLNKEITVKKVHRYELIKSPEDMKNVCNEWDKECEIDKYRGCKNCRYNDAVSYDTAHCFLNYLLEEIEVEE